MIIIPYYLTHPLKLTMQQHEALRVRQIKEANILMEAEIGQGRLSFLNCGLLLQAI